ncbi:MAG: aminopeptidase P family protein [Holosporales bacterium]|nr:aminopeptidase P family protein [Holosporales bacterium]
MDRLSDLRSLLKAQRLDGFILPKEDRFQSEHLPPWEERLAWLTGFTGSAGLAIVLIDRAALFVDGRYLLAASRQVSNAFQVISEAPACWIKQALPKAGTIGFDPWQLTEAHLKRFQKAVSHLVFRPVMKNFVDTLWKNRPVPIFPKIIPHEECFSGASSQQKREEVLRTVRKFGAQALLLTDPASIAWLLNMRADTPYVPAPPAYALLEGDMKVALFSDILEFPPISECTRHSFAELKTVIEALCVETILIDPEEAPCGVINFLTSANKKLVREQNPCQQLKSIKNVTELCGFRACHKRDAVAVIEFFAWLNKALLHTPVNEWSASEKLLAFRARDSLFQGASFETISAAGANAAFIHYHTPRAAARALMPGELYLLDSGGHYQDGTTDCTRTIGLGSITNERIKRIYTTVLKSLIAVTTTVFPKETYGAALDSIARRPLWALGLDYAHGTGHGVGHFLNVHETPPNISRFSKTSLKAGMVLSIEPGYYEADAFGIRLENLVEVVHAPEASEFLAFSSLTLLPFEPALLEKGLLTLEEISWLKIYHDTIWNLLSGYLSEEGQNWLKRRML